MAGAGSDGLKRAAFRPAMTLPAGPVPVAFGPDVVRCELSPNGCGRGPSCPGARQLPRTSVPVGAVSRQRARVPKPCSRLTAGENEGVVVIAVSRHSFGAADGEMARLGTSLPLV